MFAESLLKYKFVTNPNYMKTILFFFAFSISARAQVKLSDKDFDNLVAIGILYSNDVNATGKDFDKSVQALKTPALNHLVDALCLLDGGNKDILSHKYLDRPVDDELQLWYVLREIHYNRQDDNKNPKPDKDVAKETLEKTIDSRWLLDTYYYHLSHGLAMMFNDKNLSKTNFDLKTYQLKGTTEKAIFFFNITKPLIQRFQVLGHLKNSEKLLQFANKLPTFNGKPYYEYTDFSYDDFEWVGYDKVETYNDRHLGEFYGYLTAHFMALADKNKIEDAKKLYFNSVMYKPEYFKFSGMEDSLNQLYRKKA